jgi:hypothetical protein
MAGLGMKQNKRMLNRDEIRMEWQARKQTKPMAATTVYFQMKGTLQWEYGMNN